MTREARPQPLPFFQRLIHALPDAITAGIFLYAWLTPLAWRKTLVGELMLVMLVEFILIHSAPFLGNIVLASNMPVKQRLKVFAGFTILYSLFIGAFALGFHSWLPVIAFAWLISAKLVSLVTDREHSERDTQRMRGYWAVSAGFYLLVIFATLFLPVPEFGITRHGSAYGIPGGGEWVSNPHTVISAGFLYFGLLAATKLLEQPTWWRNFKRDQGTDHD
ncbi:MAG: hypothetical protein OEU51_10160 [Gammaproteobacteria bacterium]|nr:hypothetical protein [Gammaproteobacteria bacterium]